MKRSTLAIVGLGAFTTAVLSFLPFAPIAGGALTGFTASDSRFRGTYMGAASGLVGFVPVFVVGVIAGVFAGASWGVGAVGPAQFVGYLAIAAVVFALAYYVGLGALGGFLGARYRARLFSGSRSTDADVDANANSDPA
ncbi:DUF5518 domain-containing protein [Halocalculus aciditolerans]|uniref:DUF5518 domain-containing protein n=1 Tax=Halocalculus aciditolerans TaxID=1383812 RepID=A0A830F0L5_9EURY|nr:DUF5518 domain-containing protein [Halocalculus aciditolerans]GGL50966.1 hypothetical protein GCM10009039_06490 [Halocalculus aciditolerans]